MKLPSTQLDTLFDKRGLRKQPFILAHQGRMNMMHLGILITRSLALALAFLLTLASKIASLLCY